MSTLGCGHANDWGSGWARGSDDTSRCKACAHVAELVAMHAHNRFSAYLSSDGREVTSWAGGTLARVIPGTLNKSGAKSATKGWDPRGLWTFRARDVYGRTWACRHWPDAGDHVRMRAIKGA